MVVKCIKIPFYCFPLLLLLQLHRNVGIWFHVNSSPSLKINEHVRLNCVQSKPDSTIFGKIYRSIMFIFTPTCSITVPRYVLDSQSLIFFDTYTQFIYARKTKIFWTSIWMTFEVRVYVETNICISEYSDCEFEIQQWHANAFLYIFLPLFYRNYSAIFSIHKHTRRIRDGIHA